MLDSTRFYRQMIHYNSENFFQKEYIIIITINKKIKKEKLQYNINREAGKISALSSNKIDKYAYLTSENILPSGPSQVIEEAKFTYSPLGKSFEKQTNTIKEHGDKQSNAIMKQKSQLNLSKDDEENLFLKQKGMLNKLVEERLSTLLCLIVGGLNCKFWEKNAEVHLINITE